MVIKRVCIVSKKNLFNDLLQNYLIKELKYECELIEDVDQMLVNLNYYENAMTLVLIDVKNISFEYVLSMFSMKVRNFMTLFLLTIFNLEQDSGIEQKALSKNITGFFYINSSLETFIRGIKAIFKGEKWISRDVLLKCALDGFNQKKSSIMEKNELTQREMEILSLISLGASNEDIANKICISTNTVKTHLYNIYKKIKVANRMQAAIWATVNL
jgi:DNA-binding NarL/FixJ family response regulator